MTFSAPFVLMVCRFIWWFEWAMLPVPMRLRRISDYLGTLARAAIDPNFRRQMVRAQMVARVVGSLLDLGVNALESWLGKPVAGPRAESLSDLDTDGLKERIKRSLEKELRL